MWLKIYYFYTYGTIKFLLVLLTNALYSEHYWFKTWICRYERIFISVVSSWHTRFQMEITFITG